MSTPICTVDPCEYLQIQRHPDGTITRFMNLPSTPAAPDPSSPFPVLTNDFPLNPVHKTSLRIFLPKSALSLSSPNLPIILYFHGGGFVLFQADSTFSHEFCSSLALHASAILVSVDYRLAPESRLPAAYEDAVDAIRWIASSQNEWLSAYGDFSNCYLMGSSAGGNIAYHAALRAPHHVDDLQPLRLNGVILHQPFFGGSGRVESELRLINDPYLPLSGSDLFWELALPIGSGRDHEYCDPVAGGGSGELERVKELGWRVLVTGCSGDPLVDRLTELVKMLEVRGVKVEGYFREGDYHGVEMIEPQKSKLFYDVVNKFVSKVE